MAEIRAEPRSRRSEPLPLGVEGVERLLRDRGPIDEAFARACHEATGGNPFLLGQLLDALRTDGVPFTAAGVPRVTEVTPPTVALAEMAAAGLSNAEIAQELFVTLKTIEMHLTHAYRKLDIRRRGELAQALGSKT